MLFPPGAPRASRGGCRLCSTDGCSRTHQPSALDSLGPQTQSPHPQGNVKTTHGRRAWRPRGPSASPTRGSDQMTQQSGKDPLSLSQGPHDESTHEKGPYHPPAYCLTLG